MIAIARDDNQIATPQKSNDLPLDCVLCGDCLEILRKLPDNSVDAIVTDPPSGISFMGAAWDTFSGKPKTYDSVGERAKANANKEKLQHYGQGSTPFAFSSGSGQATAKERENFIAFMREVMTEALRVLRPGGHALVWALPRTSHWTATALEDAGFEVRDCITHLYGTSSVVNSFLRSLSSEQAQALETILASESPSVLQQIFGSGFPKSHNISVAIDKHLKADREVVGINEDAKRRACKNNFGQFSATNPSQHGINTPKFAEHAGEITAPATPEAQQWAGYGTALKPASEHWILCRKPLSEKSIAENVLKWGTGGLAIDACRVDGAHSYSQEQWNKKGEARTTGNTYGIHKPSDTPVPSKRFPSNLLLSHSVWCVHMGEKRVRTSTHSVGKNPKEYQRTNNIFATDGGKTTPHDYLDSDNMETIEAWECSPDCPVRAIGEQSGERKSAYPGNPEKAAQQSNKNYGIVTNDVFSARISQSGPLTSDSGTAARYFQNFSPDPLEHLDAPFRYISKASRRDRSSNGAVNNTHPTCKNTELMRWLIRLITPPGGIVLDCFAGSGSTAVAAIQEGVHFIGIEQEQEYVDIARARIAHACRETGRDAVQVEAWDCAEGCPVAELDRQSGIRKSSNPKGSTSWSKGNGTTGHEGWQRPSHANYKPTEFEGYGDTGGASRFFTQFPPDSLFSDEDVCR